ncbi:acetyl-CoA C-acyltransferase [Aliirhizobium cellulosilyticum]|uniref:Beta-ketothiolase n=1 Tax=Aliirhizobium cellulosilyticum TaxID=393664 RepID=A0A7W6TF64_9HYPH|nr:acetyl-CoA C-acyltransferase [Rhizobium cellulosilyticum]MBB4349647.1 acetyl-CoA C-acetyltransferase [Rhizobium cellulosilyticum]MBB4412132.1 acetyl-CoA C-acetyltransferase [Rhizobium cellulosilyticum]MBB4446763.1 acetyl-CoA C-acetyltransferase [Rhizobium cellulosilyticum]
MEQDIFILDGARTAIGTFGGALSTFTPAELGVIAAKSAIERSGVAAADLDNAVAGNVIPNSPRDLYLGRVIGMESGLPASAPGLTLNRLCGSGAQAIATAASMIRAGESRLSLAVGSEVMSRAPYSIDSLRKGQKMGDAGLTDWLLGSLTDPFGCGGMGITAENIAAKYHIGRSEQDVFALDSQQKAASAISAQRFASQIVPVTVKTRKGEQIVMEDEHPRADTTLEGLSSLRPTFRKDGTVTAGNASGINDGAAAVVLASGAEVAARNLRPRGKLLSWAVAGVPPEIMGIGPAHAVPLALQRAGLDLAQIDVIESNEAFAAQAIAVNRLLGLPLEKVNPSGGAIALGHPLGATGVILTVKALYELERIGGRYGLVTMCIGGGQGIALVIENCLANRA